MKICYVTPEFITEDNFYGGLSNYLYRIAKALVEQGHEVYIVVFSEKEPTDFKKDGIKIHRIKQGYWISKIIRKITRDHVRGTAKALDFNWQVYKYLKKNIKKEKYDVVQFSTSLGAYVVLPILSFRSKSVVRGSGYVTAAHEYAHKYEGVKDSLDRKFFRLLQKLQLKLTKNVFTPSILLKKIYWEKLRLAKVAVLCSPFYIEINEYDNSIYNDYLLNKSYLLYFGTLNLAKGVHILAEAMNKVFPRYKSLYLAFVGKNTGTPKYPSIKEYIKNICKRCDERLIFIDPIPHSQLYPIISNAYAVVLPSLRENFPNVMLEAIGLGKVVIGTKGCSFDEVIENGENGFLVEPGSVDDLAEMITHILNLDREDLEEIGKQAKKTVEGFYPEIAVRNYLKYYNRIIQSKR